MKYFVKKFNNLIKKTIFKVQNKTNNKFQISSSKKYFNNLIKKTIFKVQNKTNNKFQISSFNKYLITFISLLFFYLFYLSIPVLFEKTWVQSKIEEQLLKEFKINFSTSSEISYRILPSPHFLIKDSKILKKAGKKFSSLSDIKNLKVFVDQKVFLNKEKIKLKKVIISDANFTLSRDDIKFLNNSNYKFSEKKIKIQDSNIFFKETQNETFAIVKVHKAFLFFDEKKQLNLFKLKGEVFNIPFTFDTNSENNFFGIKEIKIKAKKLNLNILNRSSKKDKEIINGENIMSFLNSIFRTNYNIDKNLIIFKSNSSKINNSKVDYRGEFSINPFDLNLDINLWNFRISKIFNTNSILTELIKTKLLFNENISLNSSVNITSKSKKEIFQKAKINFSIINGEINFDESKFVNEKIATSVLRNSNLYFKNNKLILSTDIIIDVRNSNELFAFFLTNKNVRIPIKNILINLNYDFLTNQIKFNSIQIDKKNVSDKLLAIIKDLDGYNINNLNKSRRIFNEFFSAYEG